MALTCSVFPAADCIFDLGASPVLSATFVDSKDNLADPSTVILKVRRPDGAVVTYTDVTSPAITHPSVGVYELILPVVTMAGDWWFRFEGTGALVDATEQRFIIRGTSFATVPPAPAGRWISAESLATEPELVDVKLPTAVTLDDIVVASTELLVDWTGNRFGQWSDTIRPSRLSSGCADTCSSSMTELTLAGPVLAGSVVVVVDGVTLSPTTYAVMGGNRLVRVDGRTWPCCQSLVAPFGSPGTWSVSYTWGRSPGKAGELACRSLAINIALRLSGKPSKLPPGAVGVNGRGLSLNLARQHDRTGRRTGKQNVFTGVALVDDFVFAKNPGGLQRRATVSSPDTVRRTRT